MEANKLVLLLSLLSAILGLWGADLESVNTQASVSIGSLHLKEEVYGLALFQCGHPLFFASGPDKFPTE